jgi:hypothetical protein
VLTSVMKTWCVRAIVLWTTPILPLSLPRITTTRSSFAMWKYFSSSTTSGYSGSRPRLTLITFLCFHVCTGISGLCTCSPESAPYFSPAPPIARLGRRGPRSQSSLAFSKAFFRMFVMLSNSHFLR